MNEAEVRHQLRHVQEHTAYALAALDRLERAAEGDTLLLGGIDAARLDLTAAHSRLRRLEYFLPTPDHAA